MIPLIPVLIAASGAFGIHRYRKMKLAKAGLTPEQQAVYEEALRSMDASKLFQLADSFDKAGHKPQADMLRKRARLRSLPREVKKARDQVFRTALKSKDIAEIEKIAAAFEKEGATGAAAKLREHARTLNAP